MWGEVKGITFPNLLGDISSILAKQWKGPHVRKEQKSSLVIVFMRKKNRRFMGMLKPRKNVQQTRNADACPIARGHSSANGWPQPRAGAVPLRERPPRCSGAFAWAATLLRKTGAAPLAAHVTSQSLFCEVLKKTLNPSDRGLPPHKLEC